jgi:hypothetical protein
MVSPPPYRAISSVLPNLKGNTVCRILCLPALGFVGFTFLGGSYLIQTIIPKGGFRFLKGQSLLQGLPMALPHERGHRWVIFTCRSLDGLTGFLVFQ